MFDGITRDPLRYGSVCSGIEAATVAWHPIGWRASFFSEIEAFPRAVLQHRYPGVPLHGDFTTIRAGEYEPIDLLVGGTPCQSFSVAGLRGGLADDRGNLALEFLRLAQRLRPRWLVWENVPGVLSTNGGRDFGAILGGMVELGYGFAYRVLDAQYFGVPQRRRRVFVVGHIGDWRRAVAVLFERHSLSGDSPPRREAGKGITPILEAGARTGKSTTDIRAGLGIGEPGDPMFTLQAGKHHAIAPHVAKPLGAHALSKGRGTDLVNTTYVTHSLRADGFDASEDGTGRGTPLVPIDLRQASRGEKLTNNRAHGSGGAPGHGIGDDGDPAFTVSERGQAVAFQEAQTGCREYDAAGTLRADGPGHDPVGTRIRAGMSVRRLTPRECERLQGFPDDYTLVPYRGKPAADGPRYKALGNSFAVPVVRWIGERIRRIENLGFARVLRGEPMTRHARGVGSVLP